MGCGGIVYLDPLLQPPYDDCFNTVELIKILLREVFPSKDQTISSTSLKSLNIVTTCIITIALQLISIIKIGLPCVPHFQKILDSPVPPVFGFIKADITYLF